jgi:hypothetical protein
VKIFEAARITKSFRETNTGAKETVDATKPIEKSAIN